MTETIALFGSTGVTGKYFLKLALEGGFKVQAMVRSKDKIEEDLQKNPSLAITEGDFANTEAITGTVKGANYVVCMAGAPAGKAKQDYPANLMLNFVTSLTKIIIDTAPSVKVLLYQAGAFSVLPGKSLGLFQNALKTVVGEWIMKLGPNVEDNNDVIKYIEENKGSFGFQTIVSRPAALTDKPAKDTLVADHFNAPNLPITFADLAAWSLKAIQDESLYGTFPYVQPEGKDLLAGFNAMMKPAVDKVAVPVSNTTQGVTKPVTEKTDMVVEGLTRGGNEAESKP